MEHISRALSRVLADIEAEFSRTKEKATGAEALHTLTTDAAPPVSLVVQFRDGAPEGRKPRVCGEGHDGLAQAKMIASTTTLVPMAAALRSVKS